MPALTPTAEKFILHWGEMGARWGVNRTVAQIHALLYLSPEPLHAEEIANTLSVARSNVSNSLRELQAWRLAKVVHVLGDRRDHFTTFSDVWEMFFVVMEERKRREIDPTVALLRECMADLEKPSAADAHTKERLGSLLEFTEKMTSAYEDIERLPPATFRKLVSMKGALKKVVSLLRISR